MGDLKYLVSSQSSVSNNMLMRDLLNPPIYSLNPGPSSSSVPSLTRSFDNIGPIHHLLDNKIPQTQALPPLINNVPHKIVPKVHSVCVQRLDLESATYPQEITHDRISNIEYQIKGHINNDDELIIRTIPLKTTHFSIANELSHVDRTGRCSVNPTITCCVTNKPAKTNTVTLRSYLVNARTMSPIIHWDSPPIKFHTGPSSSTS
ncbi:hypothetical protein SAMD00019534_049700 [Acytostelium subglobosum LB1]|uniref:hypothetical protein n=1 Tax=Acytostelium subglobosum LB1 TaxID=1410327 RepID=UPI000644F88A|nr:hypothetical protein SAMD00019534_049700 [Acytostelium subglobosum LB1]GAM21795.1 hypothetical protein SAMD00019534_049700 [Acytostelium subglobosum LB1]|eukprot:XP_012754895.1 hypothetical protein SAMD00019534_049700 [Acytostelium subglobosum LB1]